MGPLEQLSFNFAPVNAEFEQHGSRVSRDRRKPGTACTAEDSCPLRELRDHLYRGRLAVLLWSTVTDGQGARASGVFDVRSLAKGIAKAIERRPGLALRRERIAAHVEHEHAHFSEVSMAMNGLGRFVPHSANAGSRGPRRVFDMPASAYDELLVARLALLPLAKTKAEALDASAFAESTPPGVERFDDDELSSWPTGVTVAGL